MAADDEMAAAHELPHYALSIGSEPNRGGQDVHAADLVLSLRASGRI